MTSTFVQDTALRMNFYKHMQNRRRRRLPHVQRAPSRHPHPFWPTYRGALAWMRKNQDTINTAIGLLDIYPSLIQDSCMDKFWEFIKPYVTHEKSDTVRKRPPLKPKVSDEQADHSENVKLKPRVPVISVNGFDDVADDVIRESDMHQRRTKIYVTGEGDEDRLTSPFSKLMSEMNTEYTVHKQVPSSHSAPKVCDVLADSDIFVFLLSEESVANPSSYRDLSAAWAMDTPTMFIKPPAFKLPSPLPDSVVLYNLGNQRSAIHGRGTSTISVSATPGLSLRTGHRARSAQPILRPSSAYDVRGQKKNPLVHRESCDLVLMLLNGYREASVWDPINHHQSFKDIQTKIDEVIGGVYHPTPTPSIDHTHTGVFMAGERRGELNPTANFLQVPNFEIHSPLNVSCEDLHSTDSDDAGLTLPPINNLVIGHSLSDPEEIFSPTEKETCYVVFKNRHSPGHVIKWPPENLESDTDDVFADSPFGFNDLDLTLELKTDLDTDSDSPSLSYKGNL